MSKKIILLILLICVAGGVFAYIFYMGGMFSKELLRLEILGPDKVKTGEEIEYTVKYKNNGNFVLEQAKLVFEMPENSLAEDGRIRISQTLKDIYPGNEEVIKFKTRLLGKDNDLKTAKASLSYVPQNITAPYESNTTFTTTIETTPITLDFDLPSKLEKGKDAQYSINYFSNIDYPLENLSIRVEPVAGFDFISSVPSSLDNAEWKLKTLEKSQGGRITIKGRMNADANQTLTFSAKLGMRVSGKFVVIKEATAEAQSIQPLLFISQQVNGSSNYVASPGETLYYQIFFKNIGSSPFDDLFAIIRVGGSALDMSTIQAEDGQVQPNDNMIVWDSKQAIQLRRLGVQQEAEIKFSVKVKNDWIPENQDGGDILITDEVNISQIIQKFSIKVNYGLVIAQKAYYSDQGIANSGLVPPKAGKATTYTITWDIKNYFSDAKNVKVKAVLPQNVSLTGKILPQDQSESFSFDSASREIVWSAGDILAGTGVNGDPVSLIFQISLVPSVSQKGSPAPLIGQVRISGENQFTNTTITAKDAGANTGLPDDSFSSGGGIVQ